MVEHSHTNVARCFSAMITVATVQYFPYQNFSLTTVAILAMCNRLYVTQSDKTSLIARKYTHVYNGIYLLFCVCYSNSVSFIELLRILCIHGEVYAKILCSEKELLNLKNSKLLWQ